MNTDLSIHSEPAAPVTRSDLWDSRLLPAYTRWATFIFDIWPQRRILLSDWVAALAVGLTLSKVPLLIALFSVALWGALPMVAGLVLIAIVVDIFDGVLFKKSSLGANARLVASRSVFDVHIDRLLMAATLLPLLVFHALPPLLFTLFLARELSLIAIVGYPFIIKRELCVPNMASRTGTACLGLTTIAFCMNSSLMLLATIAFGCCSLIGHWQYWSTPQLADDQSV